MYLLLLAAVFVGCFELMICEKAGIPRLKTDQVGFDRLFTPSPIGAAERGNTILNSVNSPGCVSTSIKPACCLTMMS
jgi:hypothetical protein